MRGKLNNFNFYCSSNAAVGPLLILVVVVVVAVVASWQFVVGQIVGHNLLVACG